MRHTLPAVLMLAVLLAAVGCQPTPDPDTVPAPQAPLGAGHASGGTASLSSAPTARLPAAAPANAPGTDAVVVADRTSPGDSEPRFDARAFAGTFIAPGTRLVIEPDGRYAISEGTEHSAGSWSLESGSGLLLLDPDAKDASDRRFALPSPDELAPQDGGVALRRDGATGKH